MERAFMFQAVKGMNKGNKSRYKSIKCTFCDTETYQEDCICVLCRNYIRHTHEELNNLLEMDRKRKRKKSVHKRSV